MRVLTILIPQSIIIERPITPICIYMLEHSRARTLGYIQGMCDAGIFDLDVLNELYDRVDAITHPHLVRKKNKKG